MLRNQELNFLLTNSLRILLRLSGVIPKYEAIIVCGTLFTIAGYMFIKAR